jgi:hypothetical protein
MGQLAIENCIRAFSDRILAGACYIRFRKSRRFAPSFAIKYEGFTTFHWRLCDFLSNLNLGRECVRGIRTLHREACERFFFTVRPRRYLAGFHKTGNSSKLISSKISPVVRNLVHDSYISRMRVPLVLLQDRPGNRRAGKPAQCRSDRSFFTVKVRK